MKSDAQRFVVFSVACVTLLAAVSSAFGAENHAQALCKATITDSTGQTREYDSVQLALAELNSGETVRVYGRHVITPDSGGGAFGPLLAPLQLVGKTNIVIQGVANAQIYGAGPGDFMAVENCEQVRIENISFTGNNPPAGRDPYGLFTMILLRGTNSFVTISRCRFSNFGNHGISHLWDPKVSSHVRVSECTFQNGGALDVPDLGPDGAAISGIGSDWTVEKCSVVDCVRGFEIENGGDNIIENVRIVSNTLVGIKDLGVMLFVTNGDGRKFRDIQIADNTFKRFDYVPLSGTAIRLSGGQQIRVENNVIDDVARQGIVLHSDGVISDLKISGNIINQLGNNGIILQRGAGEIQTASILDNRVSGCGQAGIRVQNVADVNVAANTSLNNGVYATAAGIELVGPGSQRALIRGNKCFDLQAAKTQAYGILVGSEVTGATLRDNHCLNNQAVLAGIRDDGIQTDLAGNKTSTTVISPSRPTLIAAALVNAPANATITLQPDGTVVLNWPVTTGQSFIVEYKTNLNDANWVRRFTWIATVDGMATVTDTITQPSTRYYRIRSLQANNPGNAGLLNEIGLEVE